VSTKKGEGAKGGGEGFKAGRRVPPERQGTREDTHSVPRRGRNSGPVVLDYRGGKERANASARFDSGKSRAGLRDKKTNSNSIVCSIRKNRGRKEGTALYEEGTERLRSLRRSSYDHSGSERKRRLDKEKRGRCCKET